MNRFFTLNILLSVFVLSTITACSSKTKNAAPLINTENYANTHWTDLPEEIAPYVRKWDERKLATLSQYQITGTCGGFPRINVKTAPGFCVGLIDNGENMVFPRTAGSPYSCLSP